MKKIKNNLFYVLMTTLFVFSINLVSAMAQQVFVANLSGAQEVPVVTTNGRGVCKLVLNAEQTQISVNCTYSGLSGSASGAQIFGSAAVGANGAALFDLGTVSGTSGTITATVNLTAAQITDLRTNKFYVNLRTAGNTGGEIRGQLHVANNTYNDVDGDGRSDLTVFRPSNGFWYSKSSLNGALRFQQFGTDNDIVGLNLDFDGDGIADYAFGRVDPSNGQVTFNILQSQTATVRTQQLGNVALGDSLATGDFDGDGKLDLGIYRSGLWTYIESGTGATRTFTFGQSGDIAVPTGDFDRDGKSDFAFVRPTNGIYVWNIRLSSTGQSRTFSYGFTTDNILTPFDFDGDGASDPVVYRDANNVRTFYVLRSSDGQLLTMNWGLTTDRALIGDYDGDGKADFVAVRNQSGAFYWYLAQSANGFRAEQWGAAGDQ